MDRNLNKDLDENLAWLTQKTEDPPPPHTHRVNVIELNLNGKWLKKLSPVNKYLMVHALCYTGSGMHMQMKM